MESDEQVIIRMKIGVMLIEFKSFASSYLLEQQNARLVFEMMQDFLFWGRTTFSRLSVVPAAIGYTDIVSYLATSSKFPVETEYWYRAQDSGENQENNCKEVVVNHYI